MSKWDDLSMRERAAMIKVAVRNKIFDIDKIKELYNRVSEDKPVEGHMSDYRYFDNLLKLENNLRSWGPNINPNTTHPSVNIPINNVIDRVGRAMNILPGSKYQGNPLDALDMDVNLNVGRVAGGAAPVGLSIIKRFDDGGSKKRHISFYELANNPDKYGYHLQADKKNGKEVYYNAANQLWFYAYKAKDKNDLSELTEDYLDMPENNLAEFKKEKEFNLNQPATLNFINSQVNNITNQADSDKGFSLHAEDPIVDTALSFVPFYGTGMDIEDAIRDPTLGNIGTAALGLLTDITGLTLVKGLDKSIRAASKASKAADKLKDAEKAYNKAVRNQVKYGNNNKRGKITRKAFQELKDAEYEFLQTHEITNTRKALDRTRKIRYEAPESWEDVMPIYLGLETVNTAGNLIQQINK